MADTDAVDFAIAAYREDGMWEVDELTRDHVEDAESLLGALRRFSGAQGAVALVAVDEDFILIARVVGHEARLLLSDVTAATEWEIAASALEFLELPAPDDEDEQEPAGDLDLLADLGMPATDLAMLLADYDLYPDEVLSEVARRIGFGALFDDAVGLTSA